MGKGFFDRRKIASHTLLALVSLSTLSFAETPTASPKEALMLRRITEYWKDGDYGTVRRQIVDFLEKNPDTGLYDHLNAMLGDLYFQERNFRQALATYELIANPEIRQKTAFNHLQTHFEMRDYLAVIEKGEKHLRDVGGLGGTRDVKIRYLVAESCFRHALKTNSLDQKVHYLKLAKPHYKVLTQSKYSERVLFPLAEIHRLLREDERAANLYETLASKYPDHRERFLFQAGILQIKLDKAKALETFASVFELGGKRSRLAAFNRLVLLYQTERYEEFLSFYDQVIGLMPDQKVPLLKFYLGRCMYAMGDYQTAAEPLEAYVERSEGRSKELKTALLLLVNCSRYMKDITLLERTLSAYKAKFPKDGEVPKILMIHSQMCREDGNFAQALNDLKLLASEYPGYEDAEGVLYDSALLLSQTDRWIEAREMFLSFLDQYPNSKRKVSAWRHLLNCCIMEIKNPSSPQSVDSKETFVRILQKALKEENVLDEKERQSYTLALLKCQCELEHFEEAMPKLTQFLTDAIDQELKADAHFLMALCSQRASSNPSRFIEHAEKALSLNPLLPESGEMRLELFNTYLSKAMITEDEGNRAHFFSKAANHLFESKLWKDRSIKLENFLWMANHYYKKAAIGDSEAYEKARELYQSLLGVKEGEVTLNITSDTLYLEAEVLKYSHLLERAEKQKEQIALLEALVRKQEQHPQLPWKMKRRLVFELAKAYEADGQTQNAISSYQFLTRSAGRLSSMVNHCAKLHLAGLEYNLIRPQMRTRDNPEMISILHTLKDLQIQKRVDSEPIHLEAALRYAEMRAAMSDGKSPAKTALFFYKRMRDDFHAKDDPITDEYNHVRAKNSEKNAIFDAYMRYVDAKMLQCKATLASVDGELDKATQYEEEATAILAKLLNNERTLFPYLKGRVKRMKEELAKRI